MQATMAGAVAAATRQHACAPLCRLWAGGCVHSRRYRQPRRRNGGRTPLAAAAPLAGPSPSTSWAAELQALGVGRTDGREIGLLRDALRRVVAEERCERIAKIAPARTRHFAVVIEGLYNHGNIGAVFRTCDAMGIQSVHTISLVDSERYKTPTGGQASAGAEKWLTHEKWGSSTECIGSLQAAGYRVAAAVMSRQSVPLQDLDLSRPTAFVFGNEYRGLTPETLGRADVHFHIPMLGFAESLNVSVAAAVTLWQAVQGSPPRVTAEESEWLEIEFLAQSRLGACHSKRKAIARQMADAAASAAAELG